ncbi:Iron-sulfur protein NUBPL [Cryptotermes secundus]|uniref:Iron-sulfur protein NUBPL n=1 Tax=Cryptotermes secundus TaxID=105785 RepID=A0A2J7RQ48_9NEOP|nr:iron-sulfur protein NUBPL isoform X2 [Cryptotermes secundus]PNF42954.1 Iron-sulfur protein NUBPL [Cryptotermes secundus]PNF42956.1 Iron-sulfur protein NUBPL [Cryptotermes secundus]
MHNMIKNRSQLFVLSKCSRWNVNTFYDCQKTDNSKLGNRQAQLMARGLPKQKPITGVKQIILVASGKGGVGKSTTAVNLSAALKSVEPNKIVGLLDTDVYGPSVPLMMNLHETPLLTRDNMMIPLVNYGLQCMSMGFLVDDRSPVIWRGLMVMSALEKLLRQVAWDAVDYLVVDTPPGTGDTHLSLIQNLPLEGVVLVTTPQAAAVEVTRRGAVMFQRLKVPIIGVVQNMNTVVCPKCHHSLSLYGHGTEALTSELGVDLLQDIPMDPAITETTDQGKPIVVALPNSSQAEAYKTLARKVITFLKKQEVPENKI